MSNVVKGLDAAGVAPRAMVDCSHGNSRKDHADQPAVAASVAEQVSCGSSGIFGVMLESHLVEGSQPLGKELGSLTYGQSVTDACMSWQTTEPVLEKLARASRDRRRQ